MRSEPTRAENRLWRWLRNRRHSAFKFRRQFPLGPYIVDFYSCELKLAIEVDGKHHSAFWMSDYDGKRAELLRSHGVHLLRVPNDLLVRDALLVERQIDAAIALALGR